MDAYTHLHELFYSMAQPPEEQWHEIRKLYHPARLKKGEYFLTEGKPSTHVGFLHSGLVRQYFTNTEGKEFNNHFIMEGEYFGAYSAYLTGQPSRYNIQALEDCECLVCRLEEVEAFYDRHEEWSTFTRRYMYKLFILKERREIAFLMDDAQRRYENFLEDFPGLEKRVPQYHIASYIGVTPVALSRIRNSVNLKPVCE